MGLGRAAQAAAQPVVLNINYSSANGANQFIGTNMTVLMSAVIPTQSYSVSSTGSTSTSLTLAGPGLGSISLPTLLYVTDGTRAWAVPHPGGGITSISFGDPQLLQNSPPFSGSDYNLLALNPNFRVYAGSLVTSATPGTPDLFVYLGSFDSLSLNDGGVAGDAVNGDGIWSGVYNVRETNTLVSGGRFFGNAFVAGASSDQLQSNVTFNMDGVRPTVTDFDFVTDKSNFNGILYLSSLAQGTSTFQPTNGQGTFKIGVNKRGVVVDIVIGTTPAKKLTPIYIPSGAVNFNGYTVWNGDDGTVPNGIYVPDGTYTVSTYIHDLNGTNGLTRTSQVKVLSMQMDIANVILNPASAPVDTVGAAEADVTLLYQVRIHNESGTDISPSLQALGFSPTLGSYGNLADIPSNVVAVPRADFLNSAGTVAVPFPGQDWDNTRDEDMDLLTKYRFAYPIYDSSIPDSHYAACYNGVPASAAGVTNGAGALIYLGDQINNNDISTFLNPMGPQAANPTLMSANHSYKFKISTATPNSYRVRITERLAGMALTFNGNASSIADFLNVCNPVVGFGWYNTQQVHFTQVDTVGWVQASDDSTIFSLKNTPVLTLDSTPPQIISSDPVDGSTLVPSTSFSQSHPIVFTVQDPESAIDIGAVTNISVNDPTGAIVAGISSTNGGGANNTATVTFIPNTPMTVGGQYKITVNACNQASLCISKNVVFTVRDQTAPGVSGVELVSATQSGTLPLTLPQGSPDGPFDTISEIWAALSIPPSSSNKINWDLSTISLERVSGTTRVSIPMVRINQAGSVPADGKLRYRLLSPITDSALYEITVQTYASASDGTLFSGPSSSTGWSNPRFTTQVNANQLIIRYNGTGPIAVAGTQPITVTAQSGSFTPSNSNPAARMPDYTQLPSNPGYTPLVSTGNFSGLEFSIGGVLQTVPFTWFYQNGLPLRATLYYDDIDLPTGVLHSDLRLYGLSGSTWSPIPSSQAVQNATNITGNAFVLDLPNASQAYYVYGIFYASLVANGSTLPTSTPLPFKSTRSFSPVHSNPIHRKARFYYSATTPKEVEVKVYDTAGNLIKSMSLGNGVNLADIQTDPTTTGSNYFFEWDGRNDSGDYAKNGLYLVRWRVTRLDGSSDTVVKPVALIK